MLKLDECVQCGSNQLIDTLITLEKDVNGKILVIPNIPVQKCMQCNETYYEPEASRYIDKQVAIFKAEGFENKSKEIVKEKGITQEELGNMIGVTKQRINQIYKDNNPDVKTMYRIANAINEPVQNVFSFNRIVKRDNKYYIENQEA